MYSRTKARQNAMNDAKKNIPGRDDPNFSQFEQELMAMARNEARQVTADYGPKLEVLNGKHKPLLKAYERISQDYDAHAAKIGRSEPSVELSWGKYSILMLLFVLGEIPMNSLAFAVFVASKALATARSLVLHSLVSTWSFWLQRHSAPILPMTKTPCSSTCTGGQTSSTS